MQKLTDFNFSDNIEREQELIVTTCSLFESKEMSDGYVIEKGTSLMIISLDEDDTVNNQVETLYPDGEPSGVIFWATPLDFVDVKTINKTFSVQELVKLKGKILGDWI